ncbi:MAG: glucose-6-phosphate isomerase, partial [Polaribacter sp.]
MALKNINPTTTDSWKKLTNHFNDIENINIKDLMNDENRKEDFSVEFDDLLVDFSKNRITKETIDLLVELAKEVGLKEAIESQFLGEEINVTEGRAVLHTALRSTSDEPVFIEGKNIKPQIQAALRKIKSFSNKVISGKWKGYTGKSITDIVNIGIGGSDLGPDMIVESLQFYKNQLTTHFVSNIDGDHVSEVIKKLNPETTLFVIVSKTFTTQETITNAETLKNWFLKSATIFD